MSDRPTYEELEQRLIQLEIKNFDFKKSIDVFEKTIAALTKPLNAEIEVALTDLISIDELQRIQEEFSRATGVASIITHTDGTPITAPSNFTRLCEDIIRKTDKGLANCVRSDALIGQYHEDGPVVQRCMSGGLWDAGAGITVGGKHIANWMIGQVRDELQTEENILEYAREIGADEHAVLEAFRQVPVMSKEKFSQIAQFLFTLSNQLSATAYQNVQQAGVIKELKRVEEALRASEAKYRHIIEYIPQKIFIKDVGGYYLSCNKSFAEGFGLSPEEILGKDDYSLFSREEAEHYRQEDKSIISAGISQEFELKRVTNNEERWFRKTKVPMRQDGVISGVLGIYEDITKRKVAEIEVKESEKKLRDTLDASPFPVAVVDLKDDKIFYWSKSALKLFGHTGATAAEWYQMAYPDPEYQAEVVWKWKPFLEKAKQTGKPVNTGEYRIACKDGSEKICQIYATLLPENLIVTFNDITERKQLEYELKEYHENLEKLVKERTAELDAKNKEMETFTYSVSHDLKAPLRGIDGYSRLLEEEYGEKLDEEGLLFLKNVRQSTIQMNQLIEDLLLYSRLERRDIQPARVDLQSMIDSLIFQRAHEIETRRIKLSVSLPFQEVNSDIETLRQVLTNYLDNAMKFSSQEGSATIEVGGRENSESWTVWVKDNGIGFDPQYEDRIFEIFQRLHRAEDFPGTGIGLAIVRKAVERINGRVWVNSSLGKGATFFVEIPKSVNTQ